MGIYEELQARGLIAQVTDEKEIRELLNKGEAKFYIGFDPTADSLHVGHFMALCLMKRLQEAGNTPIVLVGGGTGHVGDPSGRSDLRQMILLRDVGPHFSVNNMLRAECYKQRMERGLSFLEFNYMIMQAYDFYYLHEHYGCNMQFGGDDQWSNMLAGTELIRKKTGKDAYAMTITLLLNSEGKKMGKTASGAVWLDPNKTTPFEFFQYWRNVEDADVMKCFKLLTFVSLDKINEMEHWEDSRINEKKEILAYELTKLVHGEEEANKALQAAKNLFAGVGDDSTMPTVELEFEDETNLLDLLVKAELATSKSEARRLVEQGGISIDGEKKTNPNEMIKVSDSIKIKKGKKIFLKVIKK